MAHDVEFYNFFASYDSLISFFSFNGILHLLLAVLLVAISTDF